jgi:hypothetical protein
MCDRIVERMKLLAGEAGKNLIQLSSKRMFLSRMTDPPLKMCFGDDLQTAKGEL